LEKINLLGGNTNFTPMSQGKIDLSKIYISRLSLKELSIKRDFKKNKKAEHTKN